MAEIGLKARAKFIQLNYCGSLVIHQSFIFHTFDSHSIHIRAMSMISNESFHISVFSAVTMNNLSFTIIKSSTLSQFARLQFAKSICTTQNQITRLFALDLYCTKVTTWYYSILNGGLFLFWQHWSLQWFWRMFVLCVANWRTSKQYWSRVLVGSKQSVWIWTWSVGLLVCDCGTT